MIPPVVASRLTGAAHRRALPLLVLGPALGTSAATLWGECARGLTDHFDVVAWDLPGHGHNTASPEEGCSVAELAAGVLAVVDDVLVDRGEPGGRFGYAGVSVGGAVGLQLALDHPDRLHGAVLLCTGARIGDETSWAERAGRVRASGTAVMVAPSAERWFGPGFLDRAPDRGSALLRGLEETDDAGYAMVCEALADFDLRARLGEVRTHVLAVSGAHDEATPTDLLRDLADGVPCGELVELDGVAHLAPAERPDEVARLVRRHLGAEEPDADPPLSAGMAIRREVLGDDHVDRAVAGTTDLTRDFEELVTGYAWGSVWTRPGLDRRSRSMITLTALVAGGHDEELAPHLRAARRNGLTWEEIREVLLQTAIYCGVPAAGTAFRTAQQVLDEERD